jgi:hypothetical protein
MGRGIFNLGETMALTVAIARAVVSALILFAVEAARRKLSLRLGPPPPPRRLSLPGSR